MKTRLLIICFTVLLIIPFTIESYAETNSEESSKIKLEWSQANYAVKNGTGTAKIIVTDPARNVLLDNIDTIQVFVFSDSFKEGITLVLYETKNDTGKFERTFTFSDKRSAPGVLYALEGDTVTAYYEQVLTSNESKNPPMTATMFLGLTGHPLERAPASSARIVDHFGNSINEPAVGEQVQITSDVANGMNREQKFAYIVLIQDNEGIAQLLAWIDGTLNPESSFSPSASWIPQKEGRYTATMFVWESIDNPTALSPPISIEFTVIPENMRDLRYSNEKNYEELFLFIIPQKEFKSYLNEELGKLYFYKIADRNELNQLPRLSLLVNMTRDFPDVSIDRLALRITDDQLSQYGSFFTQKCIEQRPYAGIDVCSSAKFSFEYDEKWYFVYPHLASNTNALEDSHSDWDPDYFTRK